MFDKINLISCKTLEEAFSYLHNKELKTCIIAGGTDVITGIRNESKRFSNIDYILDLKSISDISAINEYDDYITIGSFATFSDIIGSEVINNEFPLLVDAVKRIGNLQVRNRATVGGNIVNCAPCADSVPPLLIYDSIVVIKSLTGEKEAKLSDFLIAPYKTILKSDEILFSIKIPKQKEKYKGVFVKLGKRKGVAISRLTFALQLKLNKDKLEFIKIAGGAITPIATRFYEIENKYKWSSLDDSRIKELVREVASSILIDTGIRWSYPYKLPVFQQLLYSEIKKLTL